MLSFRFKFKEKSIFLITVIIGMNLLPSMVSAQDVKLTTSVGFDLSSDSKVFTYQQGYTKSELKFEVPSPDATCFEAPGITEIYGRKVSDPEKVKNNLKNLGLAYGSITYRCSSSENTIDLRP